MKILSALPHEDIAAVETEDPRSVQGNFLVDFLVVECA